MPRVISLLPVEFFLVNHATFAETSSTGGRASEAELAKPLQSPATYFVSVPRWIPYAKQR